MNKKGSFAFNPKVELNLTVGKFYKNEAKLYPNLKFHTLESLFVQVFLCTQR